MTEGPKMAYRSPEIVFVGDVVRVTEGTRSTFDDYLGSGHTEYTPPRAKKSTRAKAAKKKTAKKTAAKKKTAKKKTAKKPAKRTRR